MKNFILDVLNLLIKIVMLFCFVIITGADKFVFPKLIPFLPFLKFIDTDSGFTFWAALIILGIIVFILYVSGNIESPDSFKIRENTYSLTASEQQRVRTYVREINRAQRDCNRYNKK